MAKNNTPSFVLNSFTDIFSTPSVVTSPSGVPWYEALNCKDSVDMIFEYGEKAQESFVGMGYFFKRIKEKELFKELGYDNMWAFAKEQFNMDESAVSRFIKLCERFSKDNNSPILDTRFKGYSKSQLIEMISIKDDQTMEKITPDMTVKQIREVKKETGNEPTDDDIRMFFEKELKHNINAEQWADLKNYMSKVYKHRYYSSTDFRYQGSPRGISINRCDVITWAKLVSRIYLLENLVPDCIKNSAKDEKEDELPGQMHIENDFPQYCPDNSNKEGDMTPVINDDGICDVANNTARDNCLFDKFEKCNIHNIKEVAKNCGIDCEYNCCYSCNEKLCGARCNISSTILAKKMEDVERLQRAYTDDSTKVIIDGEFREIPTEQIEEEKINLFKIPLKEEEQLKLSDFLDGFQQWYDNYFDEDSADNDFHSDLTGLYKMIDVLYRRNY